MGEIEKYARILWYYEEGDDDMCELGMILRSLTDPAITLMLAAPISTAMHLNAFIGTEIIILPVAFCKFINDDPQYKCLK